MTEVRVANVLHDLWSAAVFGDGDDKQGGDREGFCQVRKSDV